MDNAGNKKMYDGNDINTIRIDTVNVICIRGDFFKAIWEGKIIFLQKACNSATNTTFNISEGIFSYGTEGKAGLPNPKHFSTFDSTGGPMNIFKSYTLKNADFLTSALPAQYGNVLAGVFDLKMRNGNNEKNELQAQMVLMVLSLVHKAR